MKIKTTVIESSIRIKAPAPAVWQVLAGEDAGWWPHRMFDGESFVRLEPVAGGRFYEVSVAGAEAWFGQVVLLEPHERLRLSGPLGMRGPVHAIYEYTLETRGSSTVVALKHELFGAAAKSTLKMYQTGWDDVLASLRAAVEAGREKAPGGQKKKTPRKMSEA
ncbi:MAG: hypothetical protein GMKNLPBB_01558 [Myxococcota bacterium]|nr:hypothetical protein [Myxococcota bacterium]